MLKILTRFKIYDLKTNALKLTNAELNGESKRRISNGLYNACWSKPQ